MGGIFSYHLRDTTTHLMVGKVGSQKYSVSKIKYMNFNLFKFKKFPSFRKLLKQE